MTKYRAVFPMKYGDMAARIYTKVSTAITQAKKHLAACQAPTSKWAEVWEIDERGKSAKIWEAEA